MKKISKKIIAVLVLGVLLAQLAFADMIVNVNVDLGRSSAESQPAATTMPSSIEIKEAKEQAVDLEFGITGMLLDMKNQFWEIAFKTCEAGDSAETQCSVSKGTGTTADEQNNTLKTKLEISGADAKKIVNGPENDFLKITPEITVTLADGSRKKIPSSQVFASGFKIAPLETGIISVKVYPKFGEAKASFLDFDFPIYACFDWKALGKDWWQAGRYYPKIFINGETVFEGSLPWAQRGEIQSAITEKMGDCIKIGYSDLSKKATAQGATVLGWLGTKTTGFGGTRDYIVSVEIEKIGSRQPAGKGEAKIIIENFAGSALPGSETEQAASTQPSEVIVKEAGKQDIDFSFGVPAGLFDADKYLWDDAKIVFTECPVETTESSACRTVTNPRETATLNPSAGTITTSYAVPKEIAERVSSGEAMEVKTEIILPAKDGKTVTIRAAEIQLVPETRPGSSGSQASGEQALKAVILDKAGNEKSDFIQEDFPIKICYDWSAFGGKFWNPEKHYPQVSAKEENEASYYSVFSAFSPPEQDASVKTKMQNSTKDCIALEYNKGSAKAETGNGFAGNANSSAIGKNGSYKILVSILSIEDGKAAASAEVAMSLNKIEIKIGPELAIVGGWAQVPDQKVILEDMGAGLDWESGNLAVTSCAVLEPGAKEPEVCTTQNVKVEAGRDGTATANVSLLEILAGIKGKSLETLEKIKINVVSFVDRQGKETKVSSNSVAIEKASGNMGKGLSRLDKRLAESLLGEAVEK
ncbi:MAG: hypothetical protein PHH08_04575 [Candidatus ainarchaeum sp.]|nr:hypothetical protein [Candidatus ainarchaeum sp.]